MLTRISCPLLACILFSAAPGFAQWKLPGWKYRKTVIIDPKSKTAPLQCALQGGLAADFSLVVDREKADANMDAAILRLAVDGQCKPDASDLRILNNRGREVPYEVVFADPKRLIILVFRVQNPDSKFMVYYGNPNGKKQQYNWQAKRGLFLETRPCPAGFPRSLDQMKAMIARSEFSYGVQYNMWLFNHYNPMGPVDRYLYIYKGWLNCPEDGLYTIGTTSDGPSWFLIDGKVVAEKKDNGPANREVPNSKRMQLTRGLHQVEYYAGGRDGPFRATATWQLPSANTIDVIRYDYFPRLLSGKVTKVEHRGSTFALDFDTRVLESIPLGDIQANSQKFTNKSSGKPRRGKLNYQWDFGDGTTSEEEDPTHVFFEVGDYEVKLRARGASGKTEEITRTVRMEDYNTADHERMHVIDALRTGALHMEHHHSKVFLEVSPADIERMGRKFVKILQDYPIDKIVRTGLYGMILLYKRMAEMEPLVASSESFLQRFQDAPKHIYGDVCLKLGDVYLNELRQAEDARRTFERFVALGDQLPEDSLTIAYLLLGQLYLTEGNLEKAREVYGKAEGMRTRRRRWQVEQLKIGANEISVIAALNEDKFAAARETLGDWEKEFPKDVLRGRTIFLRAKSYYMEKEYERAALEFKRSLTANPSGPWVPESYYLLGDAHSQLKEYALASDALQKLVGEFPKSRHAGNGQKLLRKVKRKL